MERTFLHVDMDAFFTSVEQRDRPELWGRPVVVGAPPDRRGVVAAASYEARKFGVYSAMPSREAYRRCPCAVFLPPDFKRYVEASRQVFAILEKFTPDVEPLSIDEAFLDVTGARRLFGDGPRIAARIRAAIFKRTGLTASVGVAPNKFLAKLASDMNKPNGITVVPRSPAQIRDFLAPLPAGRIWGVGKVTRQVLADAGLHTIGDLQRQRPERLARIVGRAAASDLLALAFGRDTREIQLDRVEKSISREYTFPEDCEDPAELEQVLYFLVEDVARRLRRRGKRARTAQLKLRWKGFQTITRRRTLDSTVCDSFSLQSAAGDLFRAQPLEKPVRLIGFGVSGFDEASAGQMELFDATPVKRVKAERLSKAVDAIRDRFGPSSIGRLYPGGTPFPGVLHDGEDD